MIQNITEWALESDAFHCLCAREAQSTIWTGSKFEVFQRASSATKGMIATEMAAAIMQKMYGFTFEKRSGRGNELILRSETLSWKVAVKSSTCWKNVEGTYCFQQIRPDDDFDRMICLGFNPNWLAAWWLTKDDINHYVLGNNKLRQHKGMYGGQELYWVNGFIPAWFRDLKTWNEV